MVKEHMGEAGMPTHETKCVDGRQMNVHALRRSLKDLLLGMVVEGCEMSALKRSRKVTRTVGELDLGLVSRAQIIYQTSEEQGSKKECVTIVMGKLTVWRAKRSFRS